MMPPCDACDGETDYHRHARARTVEIGPAVTSVTPPFEVRTVDPAAILIDGPAARDAARAAIGVLPRGTVVLFVMPEEGQP